MTGRSPSGRATHEPGLASRPGHSVSVPNAVAEALRAPLSPEEFDRRTIDCADPARYQEIRQIEIDSFIRGMECHDAFWMVVTVLPNSALYSPWYGSAHHLYSVAADALEAALEAQGIEAQRAATAKQGAVEDESPVANGDAPNPSNQSAQEARHG